MDGQDDINNGGRVIPIRQFVGARHASPTFLHATQGGRSPIKQFNHPAFTPTALNSGAQRRVAHAGLPITHMIEPQRGST